MSEVFSIALQGMQADALRLEQVAANLANALSLGYKRGIAVQAPVTAAFASRFASAVESAATADIPASTQTAMPNITVRADLRAGSLKATGAPLDLAIAGKGFFEVATPDGAAYTRQGNFRVDGTGRLVTSQGYPVMGATGEIALTTSNVVITPEGRVLPQGGGADDALAEIRLVDFADGASPRPLGGGLFASEPGMRTLPAAERRMRQGWLENSNVDATREMTELVQLMRHFESLQKVAQGYGDMVSTAIRKLGEA